MSRLPRVRWFAGGWVVGDPRRGEMTVWSRSLRWAIKRWRLLNA